MFKTFIQDYQYTIQISLLKALLLLQNYVLKVNHKSELFLFLDSQNHIYYIILLRPKSTVPLGKLQKYAVLALHICV